MPSLNGAVVLVTGANGGIGTHLVHDALARGAAKVYATARSPPAWNDERIVPLTPESILVDVHSVASWYAFGGVYSASKAALWSATNTLRVELAPKGVHVTGVHMATSTPPWPRRRTGPRCCRQSW